MILQYTLPYDADMLKSDTGKPYHIFKVMIYYEIFYFN